jgi:hypothetical protein
MSRSFSGFAIIETGEDRGMDELTRKRLEHNEQVFRAVNEEIDDGTDGKRELEYVCECADAGCSATIRLTHDQYTRAREDEKRYVVVPGHEVAGLERVVESHDSYLLVEKA